MKSKTYNAGANAERTSILAKIRSDLKKLPCCGQASEWGRDLVQWLLKRHERYNKRAGGLGKKTLTALILAFSLALPVAISTGCKSPTTQKVSVNTLFTLHKTADAALDGYLDLVNQGKLATNSVPKVLASYTQFQGVYNTAILFVANNTNAVPPQAVVDAAVDFANTVTSAKKGAL
jgi:hypothetical protein